MGIRSLVLSVAGTAAIVCTLGAAQDKAPADASQSPQEGFRFKSGVELINVTATVTDQQGRFVPGLRREDFVVYDDGEPQTISHFSSERVPVSLGIALDTSGSMTVEKMSSARSAVERLMNDLLNHPDDEMFLYRFANASELVQPWTADRHLLKRALGELYAGGGTAMYDALAEAVPVAQSGRNSKKALVVISDGNDTGSATTVSQLRGIIRDSEVIVYAIGVDGDSRDIFSGRPQRPSFPIPPFPIPGRGGQGRGRPPIIIGGGGGNPGGTSGGVWSRGSNDQVNAGALRSITDDTGGRTEIVGDARDLGGATARIADELGKQYYLGYASPARKDGRWHAIRVEARDRNLRVRARKGYNAS